MVEYVQGTLKEATYRHQGKRMDLRRRRQVQIRDWLIYGCSCAPRNGVFKSSEPLPIESEDLNWSLRQLILHPAYQMQSLSLLCCDGVTKTVECGVISPINHSVVCFFLFLLYLFKQKKVRA